MEARQQGRPRGFDADTALHEAMLVFWAQGYDGATLSDLTEAMGISRKSMYAAFGNKEELFRKALQRYTDGPASYFARALQEPTARDVAQAFLSGSVLSNTRPEGPAGCLGVQGALAVGRSGQVAHQILSDWRVLGLQLLQDRFQRAQDEADLPADSQPRVLAAYLMTVANGLTVQAKGGAAREDLTLVADAALRRWPPA